MLKNNSLLLSYKIFQTYPQYMVSVYDRGLFFSKLLCVRLMKNNEKPIPRQIDLFLLTQFVSNENRHPTQKEVQKQQI